MKGGVLLLAVLPDVGKTGVLHSFKGLLAGRRIRGFLTDEIRSERGRQS